MTKQPRDHHVPGPWSLAHRYWLTPRAYRALGVERPNPDPAPQLTLGEFYANEMQMQNANANDKGGAGSVFRDARAHDPARFRSLSHDPSVVSDG